MQSEFFALLIESLARSTMRRTFRKSSSRKQFDFKRPGQCRAGQDCSARLATIRAIDQLRRRRKTLSIADNDRATNTDAHEHAVGAELAAWLRNAASKLPEQQAAIFSLTHFEQLDRNEVAAVLNISPESVSTALYKARQRLREQLNITHGAQNQ